MLRTHLIATYLCVLAAYASTNFAQDFRPDSKPTVEQRDQLWDRAMEIKSAARFDEATRLFEQVFALERRMFGDANEDLIGTLDVLCEIAELRDDVQAAIEYRKRQHRMKEQMYGKSDYRTQDAARAIIDARRDATRSSEDRDRLQQASKLHLDALDLLDKAAYRQALALAEQELKIRKELLGEKHPKYANSLNSLAVICNSMGDSARAAASHALAIEIQKTTVGEKHRDYARSLNNLAELYDTMGNYSRAEPLYTRALGIYESVVNEQHPYYASTLNNLAALYYSTGDFQRAATLYDKAIRNTLEHLDDTASVLTEQQQIAMSRSLRYQLDNFVRCALAMDSPPSSISEYLVAWKGAVFVRLRGLRLASDDPAIADTFRQLQITTQKWSALSQSVPGPDKLDAWKKQVADLSQTKERLDAELMRNSAAFRNAQEKVSLNDVRQAIPPDGVIVDYFEYVRRQKRKLVASIVRRDVDPVMVELGSADEAGDAISRWRTSFGATEDSRQAGVQLRKQLWEPLLPHVGDAKLVFVSTDGVLGQLPFVALPGRADGTYLIEDHAIAMLPVPILLPTLMQRNTDDSDHVARLASRDMTGLLIGDIDYDAAEDAVVGVTSNGSRPSAYRWWGDLRWGPLFATGTEIDSIAELFPGNVVQIRDRQATESAFRQAVNKAQWLHLATHGFFAPAKMRNALSIETAIHDENKPEEPLSNRPDDVVGLSPGQLSGLVFAGVNRPSRTSDPVALPLTLDDGVLTADEIAYMQLENIELAVLSACETGLGESAGGEGILGLQRAFQIAGARTTVTSLWQIDDAATQTLMVEFYRNLFERKLGKLESLRQAQLWLLNHPDVIKGRNLAHHPLHSTESTTATRPTLNLSSRSLPVFWAAFSLAGDPR